MAGRLDAFHDAARRKILGERRELETLPGYWIRPRKFSTIGAAEVQAVSIKNTDLPDDLIEKLGAIGDNPEINELDKRTPLKFLSRADRIRVMQAFSHSAADSVEVQRLALLHGIAEHNFYQNGENATHVDEDLVNELLDYQEVATEILSIINEFNRPLAKAPAGSSSTPQNGSSAESLSATERNIQTGLGQPKS